MARARRKVHKRQNPFTAILYLLILAAIAVFSVSPIFPAPKNAAPTELAESMDTAAAESEMTAPAPEAEKAEPAPAAQTVEPTEAEPAAETEGEDEAVEESVPAAAAAPVMAVDGIVKFPNGTEADSRVKTLSLDGLVSAQVGETASLLSAMPELCVVDINDADITTDDLVLLKSCAPSARFIYSCEFMGQEVNMRTERLNLTGLSHDDVEAAAAFISCLPKLNFVDLGSGDSSPELSWEDIGILENAAPNAVFDYDYELWGRQFSTADGVINLSHVSMDDGGDAVRAVLPYVYSKLLDMDSCGVGDWDMESIRDDNPDIKVVWRVWFGPTGAYTCRTDAVRILASKPSVAGMLKESNTGSLRYCTDMKFLDIGHNETLESCDFIGYMPHLTTIIMAMTEISDISMFANCPHLEYVEIFTMCNLSDISVLSELKELRHLAIMHNPEMYDISSIMDLDLYRLWIGPDYVFPQSQLDEFIDRHPDCEINLTTTGDKMGTWRYTKYDVDTGIYTWTPRYKFLRDQMGYSMLLYSFPNNDPRA